MMENSFTLSFKRHFIHTPNTKQESIIKNLYQLTYGKESKQVYILTGYAGTGKTSILGAYVKTLTELKIKSRLLAPTGRAAKVLSNNSNKQAFTIHKQIYRRKNSIDDYNSLSLSPNLFKNTIFIVDEASMIADYKIDFTTNSSSRNLLEDLIEFVFSGKNCKLILLGDEGQLPPVGSDFSPALNVEYLKQNFSGLEIHSIRLNEVLRQSKNSLILENASHIRQSNLNGTPKFILDSRKDFQNLKGDELQDTIEDSIAKYGENETIIITRSNKQANNYNFQFRSRVLWYEEELSNNDILLNVKNNYYWIDEQSKAGFIANGEILQVKRIVRREYLYGVHFIKAIVQLVDYPEIEEFETILHTEVLSSESPSLSRERQKELFFEIEKDFINERNKRKRYELILKSPYFNALQVKFAYAITCHKAQGGQWDCVFIDQGYINEETIDSSYYRWLYTAITRAKKQVYLINFPDKYFIID
jgi:exodeoxyribonuclease V